jgi:hypothetical protein
MCGLSARVRDPGEEDAFAYGKKYEALARAAYAAAMNATVTLAGFRICDLPCMGCLAATPDGFARPPVYPDDVVLEVKVSRYRRKRPLRRWMAQVQFEMGICRKSMAHICLLERPDVPQRIYESAATDLSCLRIFQVEFDPQYFETLSEVARHNAGCIRECLNSNVAHFQMMRTAKPPPMKYDQIRMAMCVLSKL